MKSFLCTLVALSMSCALWADVFWADPATGKPLPKEEGGLAWTYKVEGDNITIGSGSWNVPAIPKETVGKITVPETIAGKSVTTLGYCAFDGCSSLTSISLPAGATSIDSHAFENCSALTSISLPAGVTSIGGSAFENCSALTSVDLPAGLTSIDYSAFQGCSSLTSFVLPDTLTSIGRSAFQGCSSLTSIRLPDMLTTIEDYLFYNCLKLKSITIPYSVTFISGSAFSGCTGLPIYENVRYESSAKTVLIENLDMSRTGFVVPESVKFIGQNAFAKNSRLTAITLPEGLVSIGAEAFKETSLSSIIIPESVTVVEQSAFRDCRHLTTVKMSPNVSTLSYALFYYCDALVSLEGLEGVRSIVSNAFYRCTSLKSVTLSNLLEEVESSAFEFCDGLSFRDKYGVTYEGPGKRVIVSFAHVTDNINEFYVPESVRAIVSADINNSFPYIGSIYVPDSVKSLGKYAFPSELRELSLPASLLPVTYNVFRDGNSLQRLFIRGPIGSLSSFVDSWDISYPLDIPFCTIYLPEGIEELSGGGNDGVGLFGPVIAKRLVIPASVRWLNGDLFSGSSIDEVVCFASYHTVSAGTGNNGLPGGFAGKPAKSSVFFAPFFENDDIKNVQGNIGYQWQVRNDFNEWDEYVSSAGVDTYCMGNYAYCKDFHGKSVGIPKFYCADDGKKYLPVLANVSYRWENNETESISIEADIRIVPSSFFEKYKALKEIYLPETIEVVEERAFAATPALEKITFPRSLKYFSEDVFGYGTIAPRVIFKGDVPREIPGYYGAQSQLIDPDPSYDDFPHVSYVPRAYFGKWRDQLDPFYTVRPLDPLILAGISCLKSEMTTPSTMRISYTVDSQKDKVAVRALAYKDGVHTWENLAFVETVTSADSNALPKGQLNVTPNVEHSFDWNVAKDWNFALDKVAVELLVNEGTPLPQELIEIPTSDNLKTMTILENPIFNNDQMVNALLWHVASRHARLAVHDNQLWLKSSADGASSETAIANNDGLIAGQEEAVLRFLYDAMGFRFATAEEVAYAESVLRVKFPNEGTNRIAIKIAAKNEGK